jgi:acyl-coenzyme A synthetase/AMP-(fatty) acid ligase
MFLSYYKNLSATSEAFDIDGWYRTGDVGYISAKTQQWYLQGRKKANFYVAHREVSPAEIEALLISHPEVLDAVVVSVRASTNVDAKIKACVVPRVAGALTEDQILKFMDGKLEEHKSITGGVQFVESVPRNATGKIIRWKVS